MQQGETIRAKQFSVSAALAAANATSTGAQSGVSVAGNRFSLTDMAQRDLDAALQLLAERAQYITGANGAAIALRRDGKKDMLCRASAGCNVPEIGALLSAEVGLSGESVRTRQPLRCDDTERDGRVNREVCRQMGIASVAVMPVVNDDEVLGVFELFSGRASAFGERDISALQRLSGMVETAVRLAHISASFPQPLVTDPVDAGVPDERVELQPATTESVEVELESSDSAASAPVAAAPAEPPTNPAVVQQKSETIELPLAPAAADSSATPSKKPLFWSSSPDAVANAQTPAELDQSHVPPVLRNFHKCKACGFPVSEGRLLCVECEEKKWRGQLRGTQVASPATEKRAVQASEARAFAAAQSASGVRSQTPSVQPLTTQMILASAKPAEPGTEPAPGIKEKAVSPEEPVIPALLRQPEPVCESPILSAGLEPSQSWFARNKFILAALFVIAAVITTILAVR